MDEHAERFTLLRPLLFSIAYEILGSATESDDVLQDSYLRWAAVDFSGVRDSKAYLARLVTRQALNVRRADARRREDYIGPCNSAPAVVVYRDDYLEGVFIVEIAGGLITNLYAMRNPEKLAALATAHQISRT